MIVGTPLISSTIDDRISLTKSCTYSANRMASGTENTSAVTVARIDVVIEPTIGANRPYLLCSGSHILDVKRLRPKALKASKDLEIRIRIAMTSMARRDIEKGVSVRKNSMSFLLAFIMLCPKMISCLQPQLKGF